MTINGINKSFSTVYVSGEFNSLAVICRDGKYRVQHKNLPFWIGHSIPTRQKRGTYVVSQRKMSKGQQSFNTEMRLKWENKSAIQIAKDTIVKNRWLVNHPNETEVQSGWSNWGYSMGVMRTLTDEERSTIPDRYVADEDKTNTVTSINGVTIGSRLDDDQLLILRHGKCTKFSDKAVYFNKVWVAFSIIKSAEQTKNGDITGLLIPEWVG